MASVEQIVSDLEQPYGVTLDADGALFVSECSAGRIQRVDDDGATHVFAETGGRPMGIVFDDSGDLFVAESGRHHIMLISADEDVEIYASQCHGRRLVGPRDLCFSPEGDLLFCDTGRDAESGAAFDANLDGDVEELTGGLFEPCGLTLSVDAQTLFIAESGKSRILSLDLDDKGVVVDQQVFVELTGGDCLGSILFDSVGQLYVSHGGVGIAVIDPDGELVKNIELPGKKPRGMAFGGLDYDQLMVAEEESGAVYVVQLDQPGQRPFAGPRSV